jgi:hypothetical protein
LQRRHRPRCGAADFPVRIGSEEWRPRHV